MGYPSLGGGSAGVQGAKIRLFPTVLPLVPRRYPHNFK